MSKSISISMLCLSTTLLSLYTANADWRTEVGWNTLQLYAGASLPDGSGIPVEMTEAGATYMPNIAHGAFTGITFTNISNTSSSVSGHATTVGLNYYGGTTSLLTGVNTVAVRSADDFINNFLRTSGSVGSSSAAVMSHAYIGSANSSQEAALNEIIKRFDFFSQDSNILNVVGMNNGNSGTIPPLFGSSYNSISVGRTDGLHSHGSTPANYPGPGRQKPEIVSVSSSIATSYATGAVASAATLLHAKATLSGNTDATHPDTIKACLMTGATKAEFPNWSQTSAKPLDATFGVGELNIFHSYQIIENTESATGSVANRGWARNSVSASNIRTYTFTTPNYTQPFTLSAVLIWQRPVSKSGGGPSTSYSYQPLANLRFELLDNLNGVIQTSDSALDNAEHIWNTSLSANTTYKLKVSTNDATADFSVAWRVNLQSSTQLIASSAGNDVTINLSELMTGTTYAIQRSTNLASWSFIHSLVATGATANWTDTGVPSGTRVFYRAVIIEP